MSSVAFINTVFLLHLLRLFHNRRVYRMFIFSAPFVIKGHNFDLEVNIQLLQNKSCRTHEKMVDSMPESFHRQILKCFLFFLSSCRIMDVYICVIVY